MLDQEGMGSGVCIQAVDGSMKLVLCSGRRKMDILRPEARGGASFVLLADVPSAGRVVTDENGRKPRDMTTRAKRGSSRDDLTHDALGDRLSFEKLCGHGTSSWTSPGARQERPLLPSGAPLSGASHSDAQWLAECLLTSKRHGRACPVGRQLQAL